jgi:Zn-dependent protease
MLGFFNLIPLGPLDGNKIVYGFLPNNLAVQWIEIQRYGTIILLFLIIFDFTEKIVLPLVDISMNILGL